MRAEPGDDPSIGQLFARLKDDGQRFVRAEIALYRVRLAACLADIKIIALLAAVAIMLVQAALVALLVGLMLVLRDRIGSSGWATAIVVGAALLIVALLAGLAVARIRHLVRMQGGAR